MEDGVLDYITIFQFFVWGHGQVCPLASQSGEGFQHAMIFLGVALLWAAVAPILNDVFLSMSLIKSLANTA